MKTRGNLLNRASIATVSNMCRTILLLAGVALATISIWPAHATQRIRNDRGGLLVDYLIRFAEARASGERFIIDGPCFSACTLAMALRRGKVCATPHAVLGFHAAWRPTAQGRTRSRIATQIMYQLYPSNVRKWIDRHGGLSERLILLKGRELAAILPSCPVGSKTIVVVDKGR
jgi:hypothetical protein